MARGEIALSERGSPINLLDTVRAKVGKRNRDPEITLSLADGSAVDISDGMARDALLANDDARAQAVDQLTKLKEQIEAHIKGLAAPYVEI